MKQFNSWLLNKIVTMLNKSEGYSLESSATTDTGVKAVVVDSFGFRQEVSIKALGRITDHMDGVHEYSKETSNLDFISPNLKV